MSEFEVGVQAFDHYLVEADDPGGAVEKAVAQAQGDLPMGWDISEANAVKVGQ